MILLCYDGSSDAQAAIDQAARLMPGAEATVLTIWEPFVDVMTRSGSMGLGFGWAGTYADDQKIDGASRKTALAVADEGASRATAAGLVARPQIATRYGLIVALEHNGVRPPTRHTLRPECTTPGRHGGLQAGRIRSTSCIGPAGRQWARGLTRV